MFINNKLLNTSKKKYFSIILFNMDATNFYKANIFWNTIVNFILNSYTKAIELAKYRSDRQFDEACVNLMALLDNISKEEETRPKLLKRAIHILNTNKRFVPHTYDEKYNYTDEDEKEWDKFFEEMYGSDLKQ